MKVLITGGAGYLGSVLTRHLLSNHHEVRILDSLLYGDTSLHDYYPHPNFEFRKGDIRDDDAVQEALRDVDAVVHLAGIVGDPACAKDPRESWDVNLAASIRLRQAASRAGVSRFVFASTCSNYGRMADPTSFVDEESELRPVSVYARTKVEFEQQLLDSAWSDATIDTVLRFATLFGLSPRMRYDLTVNEFSRDLARDGELTVYGEQFWRPYVHVSDAARAICRVLAADADQVNHQVFNVGDSSQNFQKGTLVEMICDRVGRETTIDRVEKDEDPRDYRVSFERIREQLGFAITKTVEDGIDEVLREFSPAEVLTV